MSASGWTYGSRFVLYDYETESMWFCMDIRGENNCVYTCISGVFADQRLDMYPSVKTSWDQWKANHPESKYVILDQSGIQ